MAGFHFRFAKVLEVKEYRRGHAEEAFTLCQEEWQEAQKQVERAARQAESALRQAQNPGQLSIVQVEDTMRRAKWCHEVLEREELRSRTLSGKLAEARKQLLLATIDEKVMEKLQEKHLEQHLADEGNAQQKLLDDLSTIAFIRSMRGLTRREESSVNGGQ